MRKSVWFLMVAVGLFSCQNQESNEPVAVFSENEIVLNGIADEPVWETAQWNAISEVWLGEVPNSLDFAGKYKIAWRPDALYLLVEITDDSLVDVYADKFTQWWDDDCVEIFVDANASGGNHQYNHNAFAYHIGLDYQTVDFGPDSVPHLYPHVEAIRTANENTYTWEIKVPIFSDKFEDGNAENLPEVLEANRIIGFAIAYCDNDTSELRENFIGSVKVEGTDKNRGWIDAEIFGKLRLK